MASTMATDAGERLVAGRWTLQTPLRRGQRGVVWRATEVATGRGLAVEQLGLRLAADPSGPGQGVVWDQVATEARVAASLTAPGLVRLDDVVVEDGVVYVAAELVEGQPLDDLVARHGPLPVRRVAELGLELLDALEPAHAAGLAGADLHPATILITPDGHAHLTGVGLSTLRSLFPPGPGRPSPFLAPEQLRGDPAGPPADLWSLGAVLWFAAEGDGPFGDGDAGATVTGVLDQATRPPEQAGPLAPVLRALLTKPPGGRPTIAETRRLLQPSAGRWRPTFPAAPPPPRSVGERSRWREPAASLVHRSLERLRGIGNGLDPVVRRVGLIAGGSVVLALVSFVVAVAVSGDPLGLRAQAVAPTAVTAAPATLAPTTLPPSTTGPPTTAAPSTTAAPVVPPGWSVHADPATGYQVAVPPGWQVVSEGPRTELRDQTSPTFLRIDWLQDPQADPVTLEQQASQAHAGEHGGYAPARLEPTQFKGLPAALLEFTYQDGETWHVLELGVRSPRHHVAMAIYARDRDWGTGWALFEAFKASFVPPPA